MSDLNKVTLIGNLGCDPDIRTTQNGRRIANLLVATSGRWRNRDSGERHEKTEWHRVVIFDERLVGITENYLRKGSKIYLEGQLATSEWKVVLKNYRSTLIMLDPRPAGSLDVSASTKSPVPGPSSPVARSGLRFREEGVDEFFDDDVPQQTKSPAPSPSPPVARSDLRFMEEGVDEFFDDDVPQQTKSPAPGPSPPVARGSLRFREEGVDEIFDDDVPQHRSVWERFRLTVRLWFGRARE